jgi:hypothetical protein
MDMETSLAYSSAAAATLFTASFFFLSALPRIFGLLTLHIRRPRRVCPARRPLFWRLRLPPLRCAVVGDLLRWHGGGREEEELQLWGNSVGKMGICGAFWKETK